MFRLAKCIMDYQMLLSEVSVTGSFKAPIHAPGCIPLKVALAINSYSCDHIMFCAVRCYTHCSF